MTPLLADFDWLSIIGAVGTALGTALATIGGGVAFLLRHLAAQREAQRQHEASVLEAQREHETNIMNRVDALAASFQETAKNLAGDNRKESQQTVRVLLDIQRETVEAIGALGGRVSELGHAITALQHEMGRKADRDDRDDQQRQKNH